MHSGWAFHVCALQVLIEWRVFFTQLCGQARKLSILALFPQFLNILAQDVEFQIDRVARAEQT